MTIEKLKEKCFAKFKIKDVSLEDEYDEIAYYYISTEDELFNFNIEVNTKTHEIESAELYNPSWNWPNCGYSNESSCICLAGDDIKYLEPAIDFISEPHQMSIELIEDYLRESKKFVNKFGDILHDFGWVCSYDSITSDGGHIGKDSIEPFFAYSYPNREQIFFTFNVWTRKFSSFDFDREDVLSLSTYEFKEKLHTFMGKKYVSNR